MNAQSLTASPDDHLAHIDNAFDLMALLDAGGQVLRVNRASFDILGYAPDEMRGRHVRDFAHPDDRAALGALGLALRDGAACREQELRYLHRDGHVVYLAMSGRWSADGQLLYTTARDVTAHRLAREELARSRERMNAMLKSIGDAFFAVDRDWQIIYANHKAASFVGVELAAGLGRPLLDVVPALEGTAVLEHYRHAMATGQAGVVEAWWAPLGTWTEVRMYPSADGLSVYFHDINDQRHAAEAMRRNEQRFRVLFQQAGDSILIVDSTLHIVAVNGRACAHFGYAEEEFIGLPVSAVDSDFAYGPGLLDRLRRGETRLLRIVKRRKDGSTFPAEVHVSLFEDGGQEYFQAIIRDLTERDEAERQLRESERRFREVIEMTPSGYVRAGAGGVLLDANPSLCRLSGRARDDLIGLPLHALFERPPWEGLEADGDGNTTVRGVEAMLLRTDREPLHVLFNGNVRRDDAGELLLVTGLMIDISARKRAEERLQLLATHDTLTGLPNRALLQERVQRMMDDDGRPGGEPGELAVMFLDLDRFKEVNDAFGHELGDVLLCEVAARLRAVPGAEDVIARLGGDEFVVVARCGRERAGVLAARLLEALTAPVRVGAQDVIIGASIGIAMYPHDAGTRELLFQAADTAMYRAKAAGRNRLCFFEPGMTLATQARMALELALRPALARGEFELYYQPRVDLRTMSVVGMEALLRWNHPQMGRVAPGEFIGIAEETGLIVAIGRWVLAEACRQTRRLVQEHGREVRVSVNVSARQLAQPGFVEAVRAELAASGLGPHCLELELTESALIEDMDRTAAMLGELQGLGVKLAVDDFGTGYSGLAYLRRFPIDVLKLDRSFVLQDDGRISAFDFVKAFVDMAHALRLSVVAEGVETAEVLDFLRAADCDEVQGYLLARPMPLADLQALLARG
ncbi:EAL domain-containing protein [Massilia sp. TN1-12]|uniref:EAL domain-containing protein n=1 Tax=Massilia paldalensis TaxID=3377675 RepID=UPI003850C0FC